MKKKKTTSKKTKAVIQSKSKEVQQLKLRFIQTSKTAPCTIIINGERFLATQKKLEFLGIYKICIKLEELTQTEIKKIRSKLLEDQLSDEEKDTIITKDQEELAKTSKLLRYDGGKYYRLNFPVSLPKKLVEEYSTELSEVRTKALDRFWFWCCLNEDQRAAHDLFRFIQGSGLHITNNGFILAYRNVDIKKAGDKKLHDFIVKSWAKVKKQKQSPKNYEVRYDGVDYILWNTKNKSEADGQIISDNLQEAYDNVSELSGTIFTDNYTKKMTIKIGQPVYLDRSQCDSNPEKDCSRGLHACGYNYLKENYAMGSHSIAVLINPADVVAVPKGYRGGKLRCCKYLPIAVVDGPISDDESDVLDFDNMYMAHSEDELRQMHSKAKTAEEYKSIELMPMDDIKAVQITAPKIQRTRKNIII